MVSRPNVRIDLLDAYAAVDWAVAQLPTLEKRINAYFATNPYCIVEEPDPEHRRTLFVVKNVQQVPGIVNAEVGATRGS